MRKVPPVLIRVGAGLRPGWRLFDRYFFAPVHFAMERRMMLGIKQRAEGEQPSYAADVTQVVLWTLAFGLLVTASVLTLKRARWRRPLLGVLAAGLLFMLLTLVQPHIALGAGLVLAVAAWLWMPPLRQMAPRLWRKPDLARPST